MPSHQERREPLPKGYQFGDGALPGVVDRDGSYRPVLFQRYLRDGYRAGFLVAMPSNMTRPTLGEIALLDERSR